MRRLWIVSHELEDEIGHNTGAKIHLGTGMLAPFTGRSLLKTKAIGNLLQSFATTSIMKRLVLQTEDELHQDVFTLQDGVAFKFGTPMSVGTLHVTKSGDASGKRIAK